MSYQIWLFDSSGNKVAYLQNAYNVKRIEKINAVPSLSFSYPNDDTNAAKTALITTAYTAKVWNTIKNRFEGLYYLQDATEKWDGSDSVIEAYYIGAMGWLLKEDNIVYDTGSTPHTPTTIITELLAKQERTPAITVGTIQPTTAFAFAIEGANLLNAVLKCVEYLGGYMNVDDTGALNWYNEPSTTTPTREIRYKKNLSGVTRKRDFGTVYNKVYAYGYGEGDAQLTLIDAGETYDYIEDAGPGSSQALYGVQIKRITDKRIIHPSTLLRWAQKFLATYKDPVYYYSVSLVNLAEHSDFSFDYESISVGQIVRVVNSDLNNLTVNVKIVSIEINLSRPEEISVELANATKTLSDSFSGLQRYQNIAENMACQISAGNVIVQGTFTVDGWRSAGVTTIDGGQITADTITATQIASGTITTTELNFTPILGTTVIASINASAEGITINGNRIKVNGDCTFSAGYDPTGKITTFCQAAIPTSIAAGDLWVHSDDANKLYRAAIAGADAITAGEWETVRDTDIAQALADASTAQDAADDAQGDATTALNTLSDMAADSKIVPSEKLVLKPEWDAINAEAAGIVAQADAFSVSHVDYSAAYAALNTYLNTTLTVFANMAATTTIVRATWDTNWNTYYAERTDLLNAIAAQAKAIADGKITAGGAAADVNANATTISGGKITANTIDCDRLTTSTINAKTITLGTTGGAAIIQSFNYWAGNAGWQILADGTAEFNVITVRGTIYATAGEFTGTLKATNIESGKTLTVNGTIQSANYVHETSGWQITGAGIAHFGDISGINITALSAVYTPACVLNKPFYPAIYGTLQTTDGDNLIWYDKDGHPHTIVA